MNAHKEAIVHYEKALWSLEQLKHDGLALIRGRVLEKLGDNLLLEGDLAVAYVDWEQSARAYESLEEFEKAGSLRRKMGWYHFLAQNSDKAMEEYGRALQHFLKIPVGPGLASLYHHLGQHFWVEDKFKLAKDNFEKAIEIAREFGVTDVDVVSNLYLAFVTPINQKEKILGHLRKSDLLTPEYILSQSYDLSLSYDATLVHALWVPGICIAKLTGDTKTAQKYLSKSVEIARKIGNQRGVIWFGTWLAEWGHIPLGEWKEARQLVAEAPSWAPLDAFPAVKANVFDILGGLSLLEGDLDEAQGLPGSRVRVLFEIWQLCPL